MYPTATIYTPRFWLLCSSNFLFSASFQMIIPELPDLLTQIGGAKYIGYIIALFTLTAGLARPFSGKLSDTVGRVPLMIIGSLACFVCSALYPFVSVVSAFLLLRFFHGFSTGTKPTATAAYIADIVPIDKRGEASSALGIFASIGFSIGPALGSWISNQFGINLMFYFSSFLALLSILILFNLEETLVNRQKFTLSLLKINKDDIFEKRVLPVAIVMLLMSFPSGAILTLTPAQSQILGFENKGVYFVLYTSSALLMRILFKRIMDKYPRVTILYYTNIPLIISMLLLAVYPTAVTFVLSALLIGAAYGFTAPTLTAWCIDLSLPEFRGRAMATMYIALELGIGLGAWFAGYIYQGIAANMIIAYSAATAALLSCSGYLYWYKGQISLVK